MKSIIWQFARKQKYSLPPFQNM